MCKVPVHGSAGSMTVVDIFPSSRHGSKPRTLERQFDINLCVDDWCRYSSLELLPGLQRKGVVPHPDSWPHIDEGAKTVIRVERLKLKNKKKKRIHIATATYMFSSSKSHE